MRRAGFTKRSVQPMPERFRPLAVVGVGALFPGSANAHGFWRDILAGRDLITDVPPRRWLIEDHYDPDPRTPDKTYCKRGAFLDEVEFDPVEFGIPPAAMSATDTCQLLALIVAKQVLEDALDAQFGEIDRDRASVILGVTSGQELFLEVASRLQAPVWVKALRECGIPEDKVRKVRDRIAGSYVPWQENTFPGLLGNVVAGRIANRFNLGGTNCVTDAACASSLSALTMAAAELQLGHSDLVITGGADTFNDVSMFVCFSKTPALSATGDCRPFSDRADGTVLGEGLAMVALKRLEDAERDGNRIYAVIRGIGSSSDGRSKSIYAPLPEGQAKAMRRAYEAAGYGPETVELVEAHGTGTAAGDTAEIESLRSVFRANPDGRVQSCALGSVKSQVGHTKAAAGAAGLFKAVMALHHKVLPPTIKVERPNPALELGDSPFYINTQARPWIRGADYPRRASVSSFGFGGTNFHVTLEEHRSGNRPGLRWTAPAELVLVCADSPAELSARCRQLAADPGPQSLAETALRSQLAFDGGSAERLAVVCESKEDLRRRLLGFAEIGAAAPGVYHGAGEERGRAAFLFPGQGSQYVGMTGDLAMAFPESLARWDAASWLNELVFPRPVFSAGERESQARRLAATEWTQPAIGAASAALLAVLDKLGLTPDCVGGHSFGEIAALFAAGAIGFEGMLRIARRRGELMSAASPEQGGMLSVRLDGALLERYVEEWGLDLVVANHNGPRQSVLSGKRAAIEEAARRCAGAGLQATPLPVSTAFHSPLVAGAVQPFREFLDQCGIGRCGVPFYSNFDGSTHPAEPESLRERLARQIAEPVRFHRMVERMHEDGVRTFIEVGPGSVLTSLVTGILAERPHHAIALDRPQTHGVVSLWHGLGQLSALGFRLNWNELRARHQVEAAIPRGADRFTIPIHGGNYGRPYPPPGGAAALPAPVPPESQAKPAAATSAELLQAYKIFQESISDAHRNWQANLAQGHESFLRAMETAYMGTLGTSGDAPAVPLRLEPVEPVPPPAPSPAPALAAPQPVPEKPPAVGVDLREALWNVVADATGYPTEMLEPRMSLEADLGIDSIKRVEIFSGLQQRVPALPELDQARLGELRTLADIVEYLNGQSAPPAADLGAVVLAQIADKTGYPVEMLHREMSLEADLGIDSIKRVEIFSGLQEAVPGLPEFDTAAVGDLRTIADVISFLGRRAADPPREVAAGARREIIDTHAQVGPAAVDLGAAVLAQIADKTGYPVEMLHRDLSLEADLGIDPIRRMEIFSALQEELPGLPEIDPSAVGDLRTIADVISSLGGAARQPRTVAAGSRRVVIDTLAPPAGHRTLDMADGPVAITGNSAVAGVLAELLGERGYEARVLDVIPPDAGAVISLAGLNHDPAANLEALRTAQAVAVHFASTAGVFVVVRDPASPWTGGLSGLAKTAALEWPRARVKAIDIEAAGRPPADIAAALFKELLSGGPEVEAALWADGRRTTPIVVPAPAGGDDFEIGPDSVLVVSGGARGITARCAITLARRTKSRFLLLGRTDAEAVEVRATLSSLDDAGATARYARLDVRDRDALSAALAEVRREWGPITGVIHGAGVLADRRIENLTPEQFGTVFSTKVDGLRSLLEATGEDPLAVLCVFSSVAARYGNAGQAAYAMANEVMNHVARAEAVRRGPRTKVKVMDWGPWEGGMVTPALGRRFAAQGVSLLGLEEGAAAFVSELIDGPAGEIEVVLGSVPPAPVRELRVRIDHRSHPFLADHRIQDVPVLPAVEALELFLRCAVAQESAPSRFVCSNLKVLRGIRLDRFDGEGNLLFVRPRGDGVFELTGPDGARHYEATLLPDSDAGGASGVVGDPGPLRDAPWSTGEIYGKLLFHGPAFQVIQEVAGVSGDGILGTVTGTVERQWRDGYRRSDAAMLDGGLQLARLWGFHSLGKPTLPARIGRIRTELMGREHGRVRCLVAGKTVGNSKIVCDVEFTSPSGAVVATMSEVEMYAAPGE